MTDLILDSKCKHCHGQGHGEIVCDCGHTHNLHVFGGGCRAEFIKVTDIFGIPQKCQCSRYSQTHGRNVKETQTAFNRRVLGYVK
jgi:hypothetical protein